MGTLKKYEYPSNIFQAAFVLDDAMPGWEKKIDVSLLDMRRSNYCIIGQLYGGFFKGIDILFPGKIEANADRIFGIKANIIDWYDEINKRLSQPKKKEKLAEPSRISDEVVVEHLSKIILSPFGPETKLENMFQLLSRWKEGILNQ